ncbi:MAG: hypothetical protein ABI156_11260 [Caldimonas sp.]
MCTYKTRSGQAHVVETWLRSKKAVAPRRPYRPALLGMQGNPGLGST